MIKLTDGDGRTVIINPDAIAFVRQRDHGTGSAIVLRDDMQRSVLVREQVADISALLGLVER